MDERFSTNKPDGETSVGRTLQDEETPIDKEIVDHLIELTPEWWKSAILEVIHSADEEIERYAHVISSPEGYKEIVEPSDTMMDATHRLGLVFRRYGRHWKKATYQIDLQDDGSWKYSVHFEYRDESQSESS